MPLVRIDMQQGKTPEYRQEQDVVGRFTSEECVVDENFTSPKNLTYDCFKERAEDAGEHYTMTQG